MRALIRVGYSQHVLLARFQAQATREPIAWSDTRISTARPVRRFRMARKSAAGKKSAKPGKRWVARVTTESTHPPQGLFTKDAATIARSLASKRVSPKGPASGMRMLTFFINRGGGGLSASRRAELEKAKRLLSQRIKQQKARSQRKAA